MLGIEPYAMQTQTLVALKGEKAVVPLFVREPEMCNKLEVCQTTIPKYAMNIRV